MRAVPAKDRSTNQREGDARAVVIMTRQPHDIDRHDILVVEDSLTQAQHLVRVLQREPGFRVRVAPDGLAALAAIRAAPPDLIISDIAMPGMDGHALCGAVKADPALAMIPVLLLTRLTSLQDIVRALKAGADAFVHKPYDAESLLRRARSLVRRRAAPDAEQTLEVMAAERRSIYDLLVATHEKTLRLCHSLADVGELSSALNQAMTEQDVAVAVLHYVPRLAPLAGVALSTVGADGALRVLAADGLDNDLRCAACCRGDTACAHGAQLCLPLVEGGDRHGVLHLLPAPPVLDDEARGILDGVAQQVALALGRARLYARMEGLVAERTAALRSEHNRLAAVVDTAAALVLLVAPDGRIEMFNRACEEALAWPAADALGRPCAEVLRTAHDEGRLPALFDRMVGALPGGPAIERLEEEWRTRDGRTRSISWTLTLLRDAGGAVEYVLGTGIDVTELRGTEERLRYVSNFDTQTGLPNRQMLRQRLRQMKDQARADGRLLGLMLLRFPRMQLIRQAFGPVAEQAVLGQIAVRLRDAAGQDAAGRFSEGAFAVAALRTDTDELAQAARRLVAVLGAPYMHDGDELHLDPCIGIAVYPNDGLAYETLAKGAESALRLATDGSGQRYAFYRPALNSGANDRFRLETALRRALERGEMALHYQPQVALSSGAIVGAEALLRWRHPERGMVPPAIFIPLAEECGLILGIGEWVLRTAAHQLRAWQQAGLDPVPVSVNLSAYQLTDQIVATAREIVQEAGIAPELIELELTETASMADAVKTCELMAQLKALGFGLAIDDFGTGYSNLTYLKRFPVDKLKLDRSFVRDILSDPDDLAISRAVVAMAHGLHLTVVAEGVENAGQLEMLARLGCDLVQGFYFSPAVPAEAFATMLQTRRAR
jgi:diguanylate cyclase (GGDEF)-like protein/PAS domain S-box-containing protein